RHPPWPTPGSSCLYLEARRERRGLCSLQGRLLEKLHGGRSVLARLRPGCNHRRSLGHPAQSPANDHLPAGGRCRVGAFFSSRTHLHITRDLKQPCSGKRGASHERCAQVRSTPGPVKYNELIQLYFDRSNALQAYWTLYVVVLGGLLAISSLNKHPSLLTTLLVTILYCVFAYKNLDAIRDTTFQRAATLQLIKESGASAGGEANIDQLRKVLEPTLIPASDQSVRVTHVFSDIVTVAAFWAMELRRRKDARRVLPQPS